VWLDEWGKISEKRPIEANQPLAITEACDEFVREATSNNSP
jgi:hypothetical protein